MDLARAGVALESSKQELEQNELYSGLEEEFTLIDLFSIFDIDRSGKIEYDEFKQVLRYIELNLTQERALLIFASADKSGNGGLDYNELEVAVDLIKFELVKQTINQSGYSLVTLIQGFVFVAMLLALTFVFLFFSINAFTSGDSFSAVINSILPAIAGIGAIFGNSEEGSYTTQRSEADKERFEEQLKSVTENFINNE